MIRIAAIGVSHWHALYDAAYLRELQRFPDVEIVALQDDDIEIARQRAAESGGSPVFDDVDRMMDEVSPDFVLALGRHNAMAATAHLLLDRKVPFLMEKPMGMNAAEVAGIAERVAASGGFAAAPLPFRYQPFVELARSMLAEGKFGPLSHITTRQMRPTSARYPAWGAPWMLDPVIAGGGCLRNIGIHGLDLFTYLLGEDAEAQGAQVSSRGLGQAVDDYAVVVLRSSSGVIGTVEVGNMFPGDAGQATFQISGRDALMTVSDGAARIVTKDGSETVDVRPKEKPFYLVLRDTLNAWQRGDRPPSDVRDCLRAVKLVDRAYELAAGDAAN